MPKDTALQRMRRAVSINAQNQAGVAARAAETRAVQMRRANTNARGRAELRRVNRPGYNAADWAAGRR